MWRSEVTPLGTAMDEPEDEEQQTSPPSAEGLWEVVGYVETTEGPHCKGGSTAFLQPISPNVVQIRPPDL